jgi:apolipoprotein N-acyltransferase
MLTARLLLANGVGGHLLCLFAGAILTLSFAPFAIWPAAPISLALLFALISGSSPALGLLRGWLFGVGLFISGVSWIYVSIHTYGSASPLLASTLTLIFCLMLALFCALPVWVYLRWFSGGRVQFLAFSAAWTLGELFRSWALTGFPWLLVGTSQIDAPLQGYFSLIGVYGVTLLVAISASAVVKGWRKQRLALIAVLLFWSAGPLLDRIDWTTPVKTPVVVALIQSNIPQELKWRSSELQRIVDIHVEMSKDAWGSDLVVWPEAAIPTFRSRIEPLLANLDALARVNGSTLIIGIPSQGTDKNGNQATFNSVIALGNGEGQYFKRRLVPFGEYVPLEEWLRGLIAFFDLPMSDIVSGPETQPLISAGTLKIATAICYEIVYPDQVAADAQNSNFLLTVSNDTWFGTSIGPLQHLEMARVRAIENRRPVVRATNNGVSALIDGNGKIVARGKQFSREIIRGELMPRNGGTPFGLWRSLPVLILCLMLLILVRIDQHQVNRGRSI